MSIEKEVQLIITEGNQVRERPNMQWLDKIKSNAGHATKQYLIEIAQIGQNIDSLFMSHVTDI